MAIQMTKDYLLLKGVSHDVCAAFACVTLSRFERCKIPKMNLSRFQKLSCGIQTYKPTDTYKNIHHPRCGGNKQFTTETTAEAVEVDSVTANRGPIITKT